MAPKLYGTLGCPPLRSVLICAKALGLELDVVQVKLLEAEHLQEDFLKKNPQHTIPVFEDVDGFIVSDSHAIMGYLVAKYGQDDSLYPKNDYKQRATIDRMLHFDTGCLFSRGLAISKSLFFKDIPPSKENTEAVKEAFQILDDMLARGKTEYIAGNKLTIADFSIFTTTTSWGDYVPYTDFPNVKAYIERIKNKHACFEQNKEGLALYADMVKSKLKK